jgi:hypothetical protein
LAFWKGYPWSGDSQHIYTASNVEDYLSQASSGNVNNNLSLYAHYPMDEYAKLRTTNREILFPYSDQNPNSTGSTADIRGIKSLRIKTDEVNALTKVIET